MSRSFLALYLLALAAGAAAQAPIPASNCAADAPMAGGWQPTETVPAEVYTAISDALVDAGNSTLVCDDVQPTLIAACSQVVAGTNYQVVADLACPDTGSSVEVQAEVYVPLPSSNALPEVTELEIISIDGKPVV